MIRGSIVTYSWQVESPYSPPSRRLFDVAVVAAVLVAIIAGTSAVSHEGPGPDPLGWALLGAAGGALIVRRRWAVPVMWLVISAALAYTLLDNPGGFYTIPVGVAVFTVAADRRRRAALIGLLGAFILFLGTDLLFDTGHDIAGGSALWFLGWLTVAYLLGEVMRSRSDYVRAVEERAVEEERSRHEEALRRAGEERMAIARDLHDVLAHSISIINVQAGAALHHLDSAPEETREALVKVRDTGKQALGELRSSIAVLRHRDVDRMAPTRPAPGLEDIAELAERTRLAGLEVDVVAEGDDEVPAPIGLAVYRIVQESLTNVVRHSRATRASVTLARSREMLVVRVDDDGHGAVPGGGHGHGIDGMRERTRTLGGDLTAGPRPEGGFRVEARIPLEETR